MSIRASPDMLLDMLVGMLDTFRGMLDAFVDMIDAFPDTLADFLEEAELSVFIIVARDVIK